MFESAEIEHRISKKRYEDEVPRLRERLLDAQYTLREKKSSSLLILVNGVDGAGKSETVNVLGGWLDPRYMSTHGFGEPGEEASMRPAVWRFWRALPPLGKIGVFVGSWYSQPILRATRGEIDEAELDQAMARIRRLEQMLTDDGVVLLKLWFHLSKDAQAKRLKQLGKSPATSWRVTKREREHFEMYDRLREVSTRALRQTSAEHAPWVTVSGAQERFRELTVGQVVLDHLSVAAKGGRPKIAPMPAIHHEAIDRRTVLGAVDLSKELDKKTYSKELELAKGRLALAVRGARFAKRSLVLVFEGWDASGKGGAIRRITSALDARMYSVVQVSAPTEEERAQPYLWRFWRHVPGHGRVMIFDRSWYGRVLVERVEGFADPADWSRAYKEINEFEEQLTDSGAILVKFWLHIDEQEQLRRFKEREQTGFKRYKITDEDWRNRARWQDYEKAADDMVEFTSTEIAPWNLIPANDKQFARVEILNRICAALESQLEVRTNLLKGEADEPREDGARSGKKAGKEGGKDGRKNGKSDSKSKKK